MTPEQKLTLLNSFASSEKLFKFEEISKLKNCAEFNKIMSDESLMNLRQQTCEEVLKRLELIELLKTLPMINFGTIVVSVEVIADIICLAFLTGLEYAEQNRETNDLEKMFKL